MFLLGFSLLLFSINCIYNYYYCTLYKVSNKVFHVPIFYQQKLENILGVHWCKQDPKMAAPIPETIRAASSMIWISSYWWYRHNIFKMPPHHHSYLILPFSCLILFLDSLLLSKSCQFLLKIQIIQRSSKIYIFYEPIQIIWLFFLLHVTQSLCSTIAFISIELTAYYDFKHNDKQLLSNLFFINTYHIWHFKMKVHTF